MRKPKHPSYASWSAMIGRCCNKVHKDYPNYGGRGIAVCAEWLSFENFKKDMGIKPHNTTLERIQNDLGYTKNNCRWATRLEQAQNRRKYATNTSGITGVIWVKAKQAWLARLEFNTRLTTVYYGTDLFEACCARKSIENSLRNPVTRTETNHEHP